MVPEGSSILGEPVMRRNARCVGDFNPTAVGRFALWSPHTVDAGNATVAMGVDPVEDLRSTQ